MVSVFEFYGFDTIPECPNLALVVKGSFPCTTWHNVHGRVLFFFCCCCFYSVAVTLRVALCSGKRRFQSACRPAAVRRVDQNGCLSAAVLKWGYDGDGGGHVCENTITSMSRLNHSPLCDDSPHPRPLTSGADLPYMS